MRATRRRPTTARAGTRRARRTALVRTALVAALAGLLLGAPLPAAGQGDGERVPRIPSGTRVVLAPVQSVRPTPAGKWPGGADSRQAALDQINAEVDFAVSEAPMASAWASPGSVVRQVERNPMLDVQPRRLAYRGLLADRDEAFLYDPLHTQLRRLTAVMGTRLVILPLVVWYEHGPPEGAEGAPEADAPAAADSAREAPPAGRARMRLTLVDVRRGSVLWKGEVAGAVAPPESPETIATLAANLVKMLTES